MRPDDRAGVETGRQLPFDLRRQSGVAGDLPIRMPLGFVLKAQAHRQRLAWNDRISRSDQFSIDMLLGGTETWKRLSRGGRCKESGDQRECKDSRIDSSIHQWKRRHGLSSSNRVSSSRLSRPVCTYADRPISGLPQKLAPL